MTRLLWLAACGAAGTLSRYFLDQWTQRVFGSGFPWGTVMANALGCLAFGFVFGLAEERRMLGEPARMALLTGFLGAFTTFSTFTHHTGEFLRQARWLAAAVNSLGQVAIGLALLFAGAAIARRV